MTRGPWAELSAVLLEPNVTERFAAIELWKRRWVELGQSSYRISRQLLAALATPEEMMACVWRMKEEAAVALTKEMLSIAGVHEIHPATATDAQVGCFKAVVIRWRPKEESNG